MEWTCRCGAFRAEVETGRGIRAVCYCESCRTFAGKTDAADALDEAGGSDLFQVAPEEVRFTSDQAPLAWMKLTEKGPARWYTTCCNTPVANTMPTRGIPFVTFMSHRFDDPGALGPVAARVHRRFATQRVPDDGGGTGALMRNFAVRALRSRLSGGWKRNPFFPGGNPIAPRSEVG